jgi:hypothetical protein
MAYYAELYCKDCDDAIIASAEKAAKENLDPGQLKREVLGQRAHNTHFNRPSPRTPISRADYWNAQNPTGSESEQ